MTVTKIFPLIFLLKIRPPNFQEILSEVNKIESKVDLNEKMFILGEVIVM